jgi:hypothetical protein
MEGLRGLLKVAGAGAALAGVAALAWLLFFTGAGSAPGPSEQSDTKGSRLMAPQEPMFGHVRGQPQSGAARAAKGVAARPGKPMGRRPWGETSAPSAEPGSDQEDEDTDAQLKTTALTDPDPDERVAAIDQVSAGWDEQDAVPVLTAAANDSDASVRAAALKNLADVADTRPAVDAAMRALKDPAAEVRIAALNILANSDDPRRVAELRAARSDPDEDVRSEAEMLLITADDSDDSTDSASDSGDEGE